MFINLLRSLILFINLFILNNKTIQPIIHKKSKSPKMNVKKTSFFTYKSTECLHQLLKSRHLIVRSISLNPYMVFQIWNHGKKEKKKAILLLAYIADVSCLTNRSFICEHCL